MTPEPADHTEIAYPHHHASLSPLLLVQYLEISHLLVL